MVQISIYFNKINSQKKIKQMGSIIFGSRDTDKWKEIISMTDQIIEILKNSSKKECDSKNSISSSSIKCLPNQKSSHLTFDIKDLETIPSLEIFFGFLQSKSNKDEQKNITRHKDGSYLVGNKVSIRIPIEDKKKELQMQKLCRFAQKLWYYEEMLRRIQWQINRIKYLKATNPSLTNDKINFQRKLIQFRQAFVLQLIKNQEMEDLFQDKSWNKFDFQQTSQPKQKPHSKQQIDRKQNKDLGKVVKNQIKEINLPKLQKKSVPELIKFLEDLKEKIKNQKFLQNISEESSQRHNNQNISKTLSLNKTTFPQLGNQNRDISSTQKSSSFDYPGLSQVNYIKNLQAKIEQLQAEKLQLKQAHDHNTQELASYKYKNDKAIEKLKQTAQLYETQLKESNETCSVQNKKLSAQSEQHQNLMKTINQNQKKIKQLGLDYQKIQQLSGKLLSEKGDLSKSLNKKQQKITQLSQKIKQQNKKIGQFQNMIQQYENRYIQYQTGEKQLKKCLEMKNNEMKRLEEKCSAHMNTIDKNRSEIESLKSQLIQKSTKITHLEYDNGQWTKKFSILKRQNDESARLSKERQAKIIQLDNTIKAYEIDIVQYKNKIQLLQVQAKNKQANLKQLQQINIQSQDAIKLQKLQVQKLFNQSAAKSVQYEDRIKGLQKQFQTVFNQSNQKSAQLKILQQQIHDLQQVNSIQIAQVNKLNGQLQKYIKTMSEHQKLKQKYNQLTHQTFHQIRALRISKCFNGQILGMEAVQDNYWLVTNLETQLNKQIKNTRMLYKHDQFNPANFHKYIDKKPNIILICKLVNNQVVVGYSQPPFEFKSDVQYKLGLMFGIKNRKVFNIKTSPSSKTVNQAIPKPISYDELYINWGNSDFNIKMNSKQIYSNYATTNCSYEEKGKTNPSVSDLLLQKQRNINYVKYELYEVFFDEQNQQKNLLYSQAK